MSAIDNITQNWWKKASVRGWVPEVDAPIDDALDYPLSKLPPCELADPDHFQSESRSIATGLWLQYNWRTIQAEERIALPAIDLLLRSSSIEPKVKEGLLQTSIDEKFHTYFHTLAMREAEKRQTRDVGYRDSTTVREFDAAMAAESEPWKRNVIQIAYAAVAEVSVNAFLEILSKSTEIRAANRDLVHRHNKDEGWHEVIFAVAVENLLANEDATTAAYLRRKIIDAKDSFLKHDVSMYERVLSAHGVKYQFGKSSGLMTRDMSGVDRLIARVTQ